MTFSETSGKLWPIEDVCVDCVQYGVTPHVRNTVFDRLRVQILWQVYDTIYSAEKDRINATS